MNKQRGVRSRGDIIFFSAGFSRQHGTKKEGALQSSIQICRNILIFRKALPLSLEQKVFSEIYSSALAFGTGIRYWHLTLVFGAGNRHWHSVLAFGTGIRYWHSALAFGTDIRYWHSVLAFGTGIRGWEKSSAQKRSHPCMYKLSYATLKNVGFGALGFPPAGGGGHGSVK